jgi:hypothetical protein
MKQILAYMLSFALLNVISVCPMLAGQVPMAQSCCGHSQGPHLPCSDTTANSCPYVLLEKSKAEVGLAALMLASIPVTAVEPIRPVAWFSSLNWEERRTDASKSYLRFRVLLI